MPLGQIDAHLLDGLPPSRWMRTDAANAVGGHFTPDTDAAYDLGSSTFRMRDGFFARDLTIGRVATFSGTIASDLLPHAAGYDLGSSDIDWDEIWGESIKVVETLDMKTGSSVVCEDGELLSASGDYNNIGNAGVNRWGDAYFQNLDVSVDAAIDGNLTVGGAFKTITLTAGVDFTGDILPAADGTYDLGGSGIEFEDLWIDGTAYIDTLEVHVGATISGATTVSAALTVGNGGSIDVSGTGTVNANELDGATVDTTGVGDGDLLAYSSGQWVAQGPIYRTNLLFGHNAQPTKNTWSKLKTAGNAAGDHGFQMPRAGRVSAMSIHWSAAGSDDSSVRVYNLTTAAALKTETLAAGNNGDTWTYSSGGTFAADDELVMEVFLDVTETSLTLPKAFVEVEYDAL